MHRFLLLLLLTVTSCTQPTSDSGTSVKPKEDSSKTVKVSKDTTANPSKVTEAGEDKDSSEETLSNIIRVEKPLPNMEVQSPLEIKGEARGYWFFEGDFPIALVNEDGKTMARGVALSQGEWMTEDFVPFTAELAFEASAGGRGYLVFYRDNPSNKRENDRNYRLPVIFSSKE